VTESLLTRWRQFSLAGKFTLLFTMGVVLVVAVLGLYFDHFIRASFLAATERQIDHAFKRLTFNLQATEHDLQEATDFIKTDQSMIASIQLINNYQDKNNYNVFLIDEEKKRIGRELLARVKLSFKNDIALYDQHNELIAYVTREEKFYRLGYVSFAGGQQKVISRLENESGDGQSANTLGKLPVLTHTFYGKEERKDGSVITWHRQGDSVVIKSNKNLFDPTSGKQIAHVELSDLLDQAYFERLSRDLDLHLAASFDQIHGTHAGLLDVKAHFGSLSIVESESDYLSALKRETRDGPVYFIAGLAKTSLNATLDANRHQLLAILGLVALTFSLAMRYLIQRGAVRPLNTLMTQINKIGHHDYSHTSPVETGDELETISISINRLASTVQERETSLAAAHAEQLHLNEELASERDSLERNVKERTAELEQATEAAETANQAKSAFLANMSHELRTPLSAVIGIASLAQGISTEPKLRDYLEKIVRSGKHLNRIINELLDLTKIAAGHMELEIISFSLRTVVAHVESVMSHRAAEKGLKLATLIDDAVPDVLLGDPTRVTQIFLNLIGNAIKFTQAGGVTIRVGLRACEESRIFLNIEFEDTGIGMRPDDLKQLFKPFSQADTSVSRKFGGTGLGLMISRRLAEMMDGDISVTSIEGSGTTFKVRLWLGLGNEADLPTADSAGDDVLPLCYQDVRILVADDQPLNREIVAALLAAVGITPGMAANGQEVLDILSEAGPDAFDLVLMDIQMPVIDGLTATRALRSRAGFETLPIIAMTAHTMTHEQELNTAAGMNGHIGKPFDNASFYRTLAKWIPKAKQKTTDATLALPAKPEILPDAGNELSSLRGVDVAAALARFCGNEVSYRRWLEDFVATAGGVFDQIRSEITAKQGEKAGKLVHAFKGRVGMLGMTDLHGIVCALESVLHAGTSADELLSTLERSINEMRIELARVVNPDTADTATATQVLESVAWNDTYSVGVPALDDQHKKLVGMINQLSDCHATRGSGSSGAFHEVLSRMFDYTQVHFKAEEDYLHRIDYPQLANQKIEHAAFVGKMAAFSLAASEGIQDEAAVHRYLKAWLLSHILESDMQYRSFVESKL
jgi:hemerythrin-like metal-binding protein